MYDLGILNCSKITLKEKNNRIYSIILYLVILLVIFINLTF